MAFHNAKGSCSGTRCVVVFNGNQNGFERPDLKERVSWVLFVPIHAQCEFKNQHGFIKVATA